MNKDYRDYYDTMRDEFIMETVTHEWKRVNHCQAWYCKRGKLWWLRSYETIVAVYDEDMDMLFSFGRYSNTTYQHIRKFRNNYLPHMWDTTEVNLMIDNYWGCFSGYRW